MKIPVMFLLTTYLYSLAAICTRLSSEGNETRAGRKAMTGSTSVSATLEVLTFQKSIVALVEVAVVRGLFGNVGFR